MRRSMIRWFGGMAAVVGGILAPRVGGGGEACAQVIWDQQFPDVSPVSGAADIPVGVAKNDRTVYAGGTRYIDVGAPRICAVRHQLTDGQVDAELLWPAEDDSGAAEAKVMATWGSGDGMRMFIAGTAIDYTGFRRIILVCIEGDASQSELQLLWTSQQESEDAVDYVPVGISYSLTPTSSPVVEYVAVVAQAGNNVLTKVYHASDGTAAMPSKYWTSISSTAMTAVGVGLLPTSDGTAVVVGGTAAHPSHSGTTALTLWGYQVNSEVNQGISSGDLLGNAPMRITKASGDSDVAAAMARWADGAEPFVAITGARTNGSTHDWITAVVNLVPASGTDHLNERWEDQYDHDSGSIDVPTAITVYTTNPGVDSTWNHPRVGVAGTTKGTGTGDDTDVLVAGYFSGSPPQGQQQMEWSVHWDNEQTGYYSNDRPNAVHVGEFGGSAVQGSHVMYITGTTQKNPGGVPNQDQLVMAFDARSSGVVTGDRRLWWSWHFRSGDDNEDAGLGVVAGNITPPQSSTIKSLFVTGRTYDSTYANDWWTLRLVP